MCEDAGREGKRWSAEYFQRIAQKTDGQTGECGDFGTDKPEKICFLFSQVLLNSWGPELQVSRGLKFRVFGCNLVGPVKGGKPPIGLEKQFLEKTHTLVHVWWRKKKQQKSGRRSIPEWWEGLRRQPFQRLASSEVLRLAVAIPRESSGLKTVPGKKLSSKTSLLVLN